MYDKVKARLTRVMSTDEQQDLVYRLGLGGKFGKDGEILHYDGHIKNMYVCVSHTGILINGSLAKYLYNDNIKTLDRRDTEKAVMSLSNELGYNMDEAKVTEFEFGTNYAMVNPVEVYLNHLCSMSQKSKHRDYKDYLRFSGNGETLCIYDKIKDCKRQNLDIPPSLDTDLHLLRYEIRYKQRLKDRFGYDVNLRLLYDKKFYKELVKKYKLSFSKITQETNEIDTAKIKNPTQAIDAFVADNLRGKYEAVERYLSNLKARKVFKFPAEYRRVKKALFGFASGSGLCLPFEEMRELNNEIDNIGNYS